MRQTNKIVLASCAFGSSILIGMIINYWNEFTMDFELRFFDFVTIVFAGGLAYYITRLLEKTESEDRCEKDILIEELKKTSKQVQRLFESINESPLYLDSINTQIYNLQICSKRIEEQIQEDFNPVYIEFDKHFSDYFSDVDNLLTDDNDPRISFTYYNERTICTLQEELLNDVEDTLREIDNYIFKCIIKLNRA